MQDNMKEPRIGKSPRMQCPTWSHGLSQERGDNGRSSFALFEVLYSRVNYVDAKHSLRLQKDKRYSLFWRQI